MNPDPEEQKRAAACEALKLVESGMRIGLGTGSTVSRFLDALGTRARDEKLDLTCTATSENTMRKASALGLRVEPLASTLDLAIDGADEVEFGTLRLIKGGGGALLREKLVAQSARQFIVIADRGKLVTRLGEHTKLPVEIVRFGVERTCARLAELGLSPALRRSETGEPFLSDGGNFIADCTMPADIRPEALDAALCSIAGVVETGLFLSGCASAIVGYPDGSTRRFDGDALSTGGLAAMAATLRRLDLPRPATPPLLAVMGVSASGKSTIGHLLAACLDIPFCDGDDLHPLANREKMHAGHPLDDEDRFPWLHRIAQRLREWRRHGCGGVIVSSLLTRRYRDLVRDAAGPVTLVHLDGTKELLAERIRARHGHFMPASLLDSQLSTLEPPAEDESSVIVSIGASPIEIVRTVIIELSSR